MNTEGLGVDTVPPDPPIPMPRQLPILARGLVQAFRASLPGPTRPCLYLQASLCFSFFGSHRGWEPKVCLTGMNI